MSSLSKSPRAFQFWEKSRSAEGGSPLPESPSPGETTGERARCPRLSLLSAAGGGKIENWKALQ